MSGDVKRLKQENQSPFATAPHGYLRQVFVYCDGEDLATRINQVCKHWKTLADQGAIWSHVAVFENAFILGNPYELEGRFSSFVEYHKFIQEKQKELKLRDFSEWRQFVITQCKERQRKLDNLGCTVSPLIGTRFAAKLLAMIETKAKDRLKENMKELRLYQTPDEMYVRRISYIYTIAANITLQAEDPSIFYVLRRAGLRTVEEQGSDAVLLNQFGLDREKFHAAAQALPHLDEEQNAREFYNCVVTANNLFCAREYKPSRQLYLDQMIATIRPKMTFGLILHAGKLDRVLEIPSLSIKEFILSLKCSRGMYDRGEVAQLFDLAQNLSLKSVNPYWALFLKVILLKIKTSKNILLTTGSLPEELSWLLGEAGKLSIEGDLGEILKSLQSLPQDKGVN